MNLTKLRREYRPWRFFYLPIYVYWLLLSIKARSLTFFSAANPGIFFGGFVGYGKRDILSQFDKKLIPETLFFPVNTKKDDIISAYHDTDISFPCIVKPDQGRRGQGVKKVLTVHELASVIDSFCQEDMLHQDILIQSYTGGIEFAVLYHRFPGQKKGVIAGVTQKEYFTVIGDGEKTISDLVKSHERGDVYYSFFESQDLSYREDVSKAGEEVIVMPIGSHCRGTLFMDISDKIDEKLVASFDPVASQVSGFSFGRFDIKAESFEDMREGRFTILELNGVEAEPVHMYDPHASVRNAYRIMFDHWKTIYRLSMANHRQGVSFFPLKKALTMVRDHLRK